jgi:hypothetical protein
MRAASLRSAGSSEVRITRAASETFMPPKFACCPPPISPSVPPKKIQVEEQRVQTRLWGRLERIWAIKIPPPLHLMQAQKSKKKKKTRRRQIDQNPATHHGCDLQPFQASMLPRFSLEDCHCSSGFLRLQTDQTWREILLESKYARWFESSEIRSAKRLQ